MWRDARFALRGMRKSAAFTATALVLLALGVGAATSMFSLVDAVLLRPLPFPDADRLVQVWDVSLDAPDGHSVLSARGFDDLRRQARALRAAAYGYQALSLQQVDGARRVIGADVSHEFLTVLGVPPARGRDILPDDDRPGARGVALLAAALAASLGPDGTPGRTIELSGDAHEIIGVMPAGFAFPEPRVEVWRPLAADYAGGSRGRRSLFAIARLDPDATLDAARSELDVLAARLASDHPEANRGRGLALVPLHEEVAGDARRCASCSPPRCCCWRGWSTTRVSPGPSAADAPLDAEIRRVSSSYFETGRIAVVSGRSFGDADRDTPVVIVDELAAARLFPGRDAVGATLSTPALGDHVVIGVAANVRYFGPEGATQPQLYLPLRSTASNQAFLVRTAVPPAEVVPMMEAALQGLPSASSGPPRIDILEDTFREITADRRFNAALMSAFGLLALLIGVAGIYGVTASIVAQQTREIGIRLALGATAGRVVRSVALGTGRLLLAGAALGLAAAWAASGILSSLVFGIDPRDALPYAVPFAVLCAIGLFAALLPARRAARIDTVIALRNE